MRTEKEYDGDVFVNIEWGKITEEFLNEVLKLMRQPERKPTFMVSHDGLRFSDRNPGSVTLAYNTIPRIPDFLTWCNHCKALDTPAFLRGLIVCFHCGNVLSNCKKCGHDIVFDRRFNLETVVGSRLPIISCPTCNISTVLGITDPEIKTFLNPIQDEIDTYKKLALIEGVNKKATEIPLENRIEELESEIKRAEHKFSEMKERYEGEISRLTGVLDDTRGEITKARESSPAPILPEGEINSDEPLFTVIYSGRVYGVAKKKRQVEQIQDALARKGYRYDSRRLKLGKPCFD